MPSCCFSTLLVHARSMKIIDICLCRPGYTAHPLTKHENNRYWPRRLGNTARPPTKHEFDRYLAPRQACIQRSVTHKASNRSLFGPARLDTLFTHKAGKRLLFGPAGPATLLGHPRNMKLIAQFTSLNHRLSFSASVSKPSWSMFMRASQSQNIGKHLLFTAGFFFYFYVSHRK